MISGVFAGVLLDAGNAKLLFVFTLFFTGLCTASMTG